MFKEICETPGLLQIILIIKILFKIICILVPIFIIYGIIKELMRTILSDQPLKDTVRQCIIRLVVGVMVFFIPNIFQYVISIADNNDKLYRLNLCYDNATVEDIKYYKKLEDLESTVYTLEKLPTENNLEKAKKAFKKYKNILTEDSFIDYRTRIAKAENKVNERAEIIECSDKGGLFKNGYCYFAELAQRQDSSGGDYSGARGLIDYESEYRVIQGAWNLKDFVNNMRSRGIYQGSNESKYSGHCLSFAFFHTHVLYTGDKSGNADIAMKYGGNGLKEYDNNDKQEVLKIIYNELIQGKPLVLQVNGNSEGTSRHYVTVVGMKKTVTSAGDLKDTDLLIFDAHQGTIRKVGVKGSGNRFMVTGAACRKDYSGYQIYYYK